MAQGPLPAILHRIRQLVAAPGPPTISLAAGGRTLVTLSERHWESQVAGTTQGNAGDGAVDLWDVTNGRWLRRLPSSLGMFQDVAFTPDSSGLFLAGSGFVPLGKPPDSRPLDKALMLLDLNTNEPRRTFAAPDKLAVRDIASRGCSEFQSRISRAPAGPGARGCQRGIMSPKGAPAVKYQGWTGNVARNSG